MINFISKLINLFIHPLGWMVVLLLVAIFVKNRKVRNACLWSSLGLFLVFSNRPLFTSVDEAWCRAQMEEWPTQHYTYGFIPGGLTAGYDEKYQTVGYREAVDRMHNAVLFLKEGICDTIVISGDGASNFNVRDPRDFCEHAGRLFGIDPNRIKVEREALTTMQNFQFSIPMMQHGNCITINSARYMERTRLCAKILHFDTDYFSVQFIAERPEDRFLLCNYLPDWNTVNEWHKLMHEWFGCLWYELLY